MTNLDPFTQISTHKVSKSGHAHKSLDLTLLDANADGKWCVVRCIKPREFGWPVSRLAETMEEECGLWGFREGADPALFEADVAKEIAAEPLRTKPGLVRHVAVPVESVTWRVLLFSHYDLSCAELYRGRDFGFARRAMQDARAAVDRANRIYLKAIWEGYVQVKK